MWILSSAIFLFPLLAAAIPTPEAHPGPVQASAFTDFPVNVVMTAGAAQFGVWVPIDGVWYPTYDLTCLNAGANSYGACATPSVDHVGVVAGDGPCSFVGNNGFYAHLSGAAGEGFAIVAPPQQITWVTCGS